MKQNLAKVLGMEEYNEEPNIRVEPTEDEVIQIQQDKFEQEMGDHQEATTEALEAIGNAQALASVISRNNSTDKTTYELLKVAVEQLKEKTGVKTTSVSLEGLDKYSYKTESLQDIKNFIVKVWEAIKKAFFAMVDKVKNFVKSLFDRTKKTEEQLKEAINENKDFVDQASKTKETVSKPTAPEKQPARPAQREKSNFIFTKGASEAIGCKEAKDFTIGIVSSRLVHLYNNLSDLVDAIIKVKLDVIAQDFSNSAKAYTEGNFVAPNWTTYFAEAKIDRTIGGDLGPGISINLSSTDVQGTKSVKIGKDFVGNRQVRPLNPIKLDDEIYSTLKKYTDLSQKLIKNTERYAASMDEFFKSQESIYNQLDAQDEESQRRVKEIKERLRSFQDAVSNLFRVTNAVDNYILSIPAGFIKYTYENISFFKPMVDEKNKAGLIVEQKDYDEYLQRFDF